MVLAAQDVAKEMQGFKAAYIQSDEVTFLLTDYEDVQTQGWFGYDLAKVVSTSAALMTAYFLKHFGKNDKISTFDSRAFNVPKSDVVNTFLWRAKDWERNSLQMYARAHFSHKELHGKNKQQMHNMLHEKGLNWTIDLGNRERNGTFILNDEDKSMLIDSSILPTYNSIADNIDFLI
jgi:tRNA(His) 5'-end guanylyltransferase